MSILKCVFSWALLLVCVPALAASTGDENASNIPTLFRGIRKDDHHVENSSQDLIEAHGQTGMLNLTTWYSDFVPSAMKKSILHFLCTVGLLACVACMNGGTAATTPVKIPDWQATHKLTEWRTDYAFQHADPKWYQGPCFGAKPWDNIRVGNR